MEQKYDYNFKDLKSRVGIDDVAIHLGYQIDRRAGLGRYIELVLPGSDGNPQDRIVVSHPNDKSRQSYFRRADGRLGDVFNFVIENKSSFGETGRSDWEIAAKVLAKFANEPLPERDKGYYEAINRPRIFDPSSYQIRPLVELDETLGKGVYKLSEKDLNHALSIFKQRGITESTIRSFAPHIHLIRDPKFNYPGFNLGFPYTQPGSKKVEGYEIRGLGTFKSKALGTNSTSAAWIASNPGSFEGSLNPNMVSRVYFAESAYDIMSFYQANEKNMYNPMLEQQPSMVFVSIGGTFSSQQVKNIMDYYPNARAIDCFDNDIPGRIYGMRLVNVVEKLGMHISQTPKGIEVNYNGQNHVLPVTATLNDLDFVPKKRSYGVRKAPKEFKDWNDVIRNRPMTELQQKTKYDRNKKLSDNRNQGLKL